MKFKDLFISITIISFLGGLSINSVASEKYLNTSEANDSQQMTEKEVAKKFARGESFTQSGITYTVYPDLKADFNKSKMRNSSEGNKSVRVMSTKSFSIYHEIVKVKDNLISYRNQIVLNDSTGNFAVLTGFIIVKTKNNLPLKDSKLELEKDYPNMGYFLYKIPSNIRIQEAIDKINRDQNVEKTIVEVSENYKEPL